jgi:hypothetical protein
MTHVQSTSAGATSGVGFARLLSAPRRARCSPPPSPCPRAIHARDGLRWCLFDRHLAGLARAHRRAVGAIPWVALKPELLLQAGQPRRRRAGLCRPQAHALHEGRRARADMNAAATDDEEAAPDTFVEDNEENEEELAASSSNDDGVLSDALTPREWTLRIDVDGLLRPAASPLACASPARLQAGVWHDNVSCNTPLLTAAALQAPCIRAAGCTRGASHLGDTPWTSRQARRRTLAHTCTHHGAMRAAYPCHARPRRREHR